jgi:hypothetical protein
MPGPTFVSYHTTAVTLLRTVPAVLLLGTCVMPSDQSATVFVTVDVGSGLVTRGDGLNVQAHAWRAPEDGADAEIESASFDWTTSDPAVARVAAAEGGRAIVTGVRSGIVTLRVSTRDFENAAPAEVGIRVANTVEIDRVTPDTVAFGDEVTVEGIGLGGVERVFLGDGALLPDSGSFIGDSAGLGSMRFWVAFPASSQRLLAQASEGFSASAPDTTVVLPRDVFETADGAPPLINLDGPVVRPPDVAFINPALALEPGTDGDIYRFAQSDSQPLTLVLRSAAVPPSGFEPVILPAEGDELDPDWGIGAREQRCGGVIYFIPSSDPDSVVRVLDSPLSTAFRLRVTGPAARYSLEVRHGRPVPDSRIQPDRFEPNDHCRLADQNFNDPDRMMDLAQVSPSEVLTIDHAYDLDWYSIHVSGDQPSLVTVRTATLPFGAADSSNVGIYLVDHFANVFRSAGPGPTQTIAEEISPGDYYVVVADEAGVPTRYALCIALGTVCVLPSAPPAPGARK